MCCLYQHKDVRSVNLTSMLSPRFQAAPMVLLTTLLAWKHPPCFLTTFIFTKEAQPAHYIHVGLTLLLPCMTSWGILFARKPNQYNEQKNLKIKSPQEFIPAKAKLQALNPLIWSKNRKLNMRTNRFPNPLNFVTLKVFLP